MNPEEGPSTEIEGAYALERAKDNLYSFPDTISHLHGSTEEREKMSADLKAQAERVAAKRLEQILKNPSLDEEAKTKALEKLRTNLDYGAKESLQNGLRAPQRMVEMMAGSVTKNGRRLEPNHIENIEEVLLGYFSGAAANGESIRPVLTIAELAKLQKQDPTETGLTYADAITEIRKKIPEDAMRDQFQMDQVVQRELGLVYRHTLDQNQIPTEATYTTPVV